MFSCHNIQSSCSLHELVEVLITSIEAKDNYTKGHSDRVAEITSLILKRMNVSDEFINRIHIAAHLHDLGKIYVKDHILTKKERLDDHEWDEIKKHPDVGADILTKVSGFKDIIDMVRAHHERWDGDGYPNRLNGEDIPLGARVIAVADSIDAMLSERPYRKGLDKSICANEIQKGIGFQFDPQVATIAYDILIEGGLDHLYNMTTTTENVV